VYKSLIIKIDEIIKETKDTSKKNLLGYLKNKIEEKIVVVKVEIEKEYQASQDTTNTNSSEHNKQEASRVELYRDIII
jgi:hypothetical protein